MRRFGNRHNIVVVVMGHPVNGNEHLSLAILINLNDEVEKNRLEGAIDELFEEASL